MPLRDALHSKENCDTPSAMESPASPNPWCWPLAVGRFSGRIHLHMAGFGRISGSGLVLQFSALFDLIM
jgi:hypothetical protein